MIVNLQVFHDDLSSSGHEQSALSQMAGFAVRENRFRKEMERLRSTQSKDLVLDVDRERHMLIQQTIKQLNVAFQRRSSCVVTGIAPLSVHKVSLMLTIMILGNARVQCVPLESYSITVFHNCP